MPKAPRKHPFAELFDNFNAEGKRSLAARLGTSVESLRQMVRGYRTDGQPRLSPEMAAKVEKQTGIHRELTCPACAACNLAKAARIALKGKQ